MYCIVYPVGDFNERRTAESSRSFDPSRRQPFIKGRRKVGIENVISCSLHKRWKPDENKSCKCGITALKLKTNEWWAFAIDINRPEVRKYRLHFTSTPFCFDVCKYGALANALSIAPFLYYIICVLFVQIVTELIDVFSKKLKMILLVNFVAIYNREQKHKQNA